MNNDKGNVNGIGVSGLLLVLFIGLKLGKIIAWSWLWVLSPFWIPFLIGIIAILIALLVAAP